MNPFYLCGDLTFGVNKEQRNIYIIGGIDGDKSMFSALHCFMPSKQAKAYHWVFNTAAKYLLTPGILAQNHAFSTDQEKAMHDALRLQMNRPLLPFSHHRFDMYHIFTQHWKNNVEFLVKGTKCHAILKKLHNLIKQFFSYCESKLEVDCI